MIKPSEEVSILLLALELTELAEKQFASQTDSFSLYREFAFTIKKHIKECKE